MIEAVHLEFTRPPTDDDYIGWHADGPINSVITTRAHAIGWVVVGAESGPGRRPCKLEWIESVVDQCFKAGVPCYVKLIDHEGKVIVPGDPNWPEWAKQEMP